MVQLHEATGNRSVDALLNDLVAQRTSGDLCSLVASKPHAPLAGASRPRNVPRRADTPVPAEDQRRTVLLRLRSGTQVAIDAYAHEEASVRGDGSRSFRFAFSLDDTMLDIYGCWNGEAYELDRVMAAMDHWESDTRDVFRFLHGVRGEDGRCLVQHAYMGPDTGWMSPEACSMVYHADARELLLDVARCYLSLEHGVSMTEALPLTFDDIRERRGQGRPQEDEEYLSFVGVGSTGPARTFRNFVTVDGLSRLGDLDSAAARTIFELVADEHNRAVRQDRLKRSKKRAILEGLGLVRLLGREASVEVSTVADGGTAIMTNPCSTLLHVYQMAYELGLGA